jgi:transcriptional regulator of acetoin/glycerol metabolism
VSAAAPLVLVIDDDPGMLALVKRAVQSTGLRIVPHTSAHERLATRPGVLWSGNVAELCDVLERVSMLVDGRISRPTLAEPVARGAVEREHIVRILQESQGNKRLTAHRLGISRRTLYRRLARHGLMPGGHSSG